MGQFVIDIILCLIAYGVLIYFLSVFLRKSRKGPNKGGGKDGGDGGISIDKTPKLDLPPGVCLPKGNGKRSRPDTSPVRKREKEVGVW